jgi:hypothetical protein
MMNQVPYTLEQVAFAKSRTNKMLDLVNAQQKVVGESMDKIEPNDLYLTIAILKSRELMLVEELKALDRIAVSIVQTNT